jgi:hypothetical protein
LLAIRLLVPGWGAEEALADSPVSEAADQVSTLLDRLENPRILFVEWIEATITATILHHRSAHRRAQFLKRGWRLDGSQARIIQIETNKEPPIDV